MLTSMRLWSSRARRANENADVSERNSSARETANSPSSGVVERVGRVEAAEAASKRLCLGGRTDTYA